LSFSRKLENLAISPMKDFAFLNAAKATSELDSGCGVPLGPVVRLLFTT